MTLFGKLSRIIYSRAAGKCPEQRVAIVYINRGTAIEV
nr:MAG TPA: hypothetical protein [Caudoviricetes sp.]DAI25505.1 MAG TPA: hypothetical protein [Caudoviricetes sp.]